MTHYDDGGNVRVDFAWGNMPMQPDDVREDSLDEELDNHATAIYGWGNFPGFIPNYEGDGDSGLEAVVPDLLRKTTDEAYDLLNAVNLNDRFYAHYLQIFGLVSTGTTVRVYAYDSNAYGGGYPQAYTVGLRPGDKVIVDNSEYNFGGEVTITEVNDDGENSWIEFRTSTDLGLDTGASGYIYAGSNLQNVITVQRSWNNPGDIRNEYTNIYARYLGSD